MQNRAYIPFIVVLLILVLDQILKFWIKTNFVLGEELKVLGLDWFRIHFTENEGMAFGMSLGGQNGKLFLTLFRLIAVVGIGWYISFLIRIKAPLGLLISLSMVLAGALGNIIDSVFYGVIFSGSLGQLATFMPEGGGYSSWFHGSVVDMLYFPFADGFLPDWLPFKGGDYFIFFRPVFNIADTAITTGVISILVFQRRFFTHPQIEPDQSAEAIEP